MVFVKKSYIVKNAFDRWRHITRFVIQEDSNIMFKSLPLSIMLLGSSGYHSLRI